MLVCMHVLITVAKKMERTLNKAVSVYRLPPTLTLNHPRPCA